MARTTKFEELILKSFLNKFPGRTAEEQFEHMVVDPMIAQIILKNQKEKFFVDKDKESIELLKIILAGERVFVQQYDGPSENIFHHKDRFFYCGRFFNLRNFYLYRFGNEFHRDGLSEFLLKILNNHNFFNQIKQNRKNIMLFLLLFEYENKGHSPDP
jgi:hypothetical protein